MNQISSEKEKQAHYFFSNKWGQTIEHDPQTNSKLLTKFK